MAADDKLFFHKTVLHLARSLACIKDTPWERVKTLFTLCPKETANGVYRLGNRDMDAVIALGVYLLESQLQHKDRILPYLLRLARGLGKVVWLDEVRQNSTDRIPVAEKFSFSLHTLLSDVAARCPESIDEIITTQVDCLALLTTSIGHLQEQSSNSSSTKLYLCRGTVPVLIGLARARGRFTITDPPLICRLYPKPEPSIISAHINVERTNTKNTFSKFWSIIPRSLSGNLSVTSDMLGLTQGYDATDPANQTHLTIRGAGYATGNYDPTTYFFSKFGSSFNQFPNMKFYDSNEKKHNILFPHIHLQTILAFAKKLLTKDMLTFLDEQSLEIFSTGKILIFPYKTFSETINLVMVTLLRELLQPHKDLPVPFTKDVQEFVKGLFLNGQTELQSKNHDASEKEDKETNYSLVNKFKVNVMANAACVDLLVWAIGDETEAQQKMYNIWQ